MPSRAWVPRLQAAGAPPCARSQCGLSGPALWFPGGSFGARLRITLSANLGSHPSSLAKRPCERGMSPCHRLGALWGLSEMTHSFN